MARPPKFRPCAQCGALKPSSCLRPSSGVHGKPDVCFVCVPKRGRTPEAARLAESVLLSRSAVNGLPGAKQRRHDVRAQSMDLAKTYERAQGEISISEFMKAPLAEQLGIPVPVLAKCTCCFTTEGTSFDVEGRAWCRYCGLHVFTCGRCPSHGETVFFPALAGNPPPYVDLPDPLAPKFKPARPSEELDAFDDL